MDNRSLISKLQTFLIILAAVLMLVSCLRPSAATPGETALASAPVTTDSLSPEISEEPLSTFYVPASETIDVRPVPKPNESTDMPVDLPEYVPADPVMEMVSSLSDEELIGQMVMCGFSGVSSPSSDFLAFMEKYKVGNVILFGDNIETDEQTRKLTSVLNEHNPVKDIPLFISTDLEGGSVRRFNSWKPNILSAKRLYQKDDPEFTYEQFLRISVRLKECGINMNLAPVLDMSKNQDATFLGTRIFGGDPERVSEQANAAVAGIKDGGAGGTNCSPCGVKRVSLTPNIVGTEGPYKSASIMPTFAPAFAKATAKFAVTVLLPTPPLPLATAITFLISGCV